MKVLHLSNTYQRPDLFDWAAAKSGSAVDYRIRWVARHRGVSLATAATLIANAGFSNGEAR
jgi:hypothetical protein